MTLRYREHFHLDYWQMYFTPYHIMIRDLKILSIEEEIKSEYRRQKKPKK